MEIIPEYALENSESWQSIHKYNAWFVKIRYLAVVVLIGFIISITKIIDLKFSTFQFHTLSILSIFIIVYNILFQRMQEKILQKTLNLTPFHFSFIQIITDLGFLSIIVYILGGIESPFFLFYIFHMIIGSIILPAVIMYIIGSILVSILSVLSYLELSGVIAHQTVVGLYNFSFYTDAGFLISFLSVFTMMIFISIYFTSKITRELYERENQLKLAMVEIKNAEISKQKYIMAIVHELKSPIAAASSQLEIITGGFVGAVSEEVYNKITRANSRLFDAISNINNILRVSKFKLLNKIEKEETDIIKIITNNIESSRTVREKKNIRLGLDLLADEYLISADTVLINLVISNLINNAVKYTPEDGEICVNVKLDQNLLTIEIEDDGIGIPQNEIEYIFNEFYRASNANNSKIEGTGTGLGFVKQIVNLHDGIIKVESPSGISKKDRPGTKVTLNLPIINN